MAHMIPETPKDFNPASKEDVMFHALEDLPDSYYVFHSFHIISVEDNAIHESETDFLIYNRTKGILCIEAKAGSGIHFDHGEWYYSDGRTMSHGGPFGQVRRNMYNVRDRFKGSVLECLLPRCKFLSAVWFPDIPESKLQKMAYPSEADKSLTLTTEALYNPEQYIEKLFELSSYYEGKAITSTVISENESLCLIRNILCPSFNVFPSASFDVDMKKVSFHRLLKEQSHILDFLEEQHTAAINGAAGTGKTMIALEQANRHAAEGDRVLFLCYNKMLHEYFRSHHSNPQIDFYTLDGFACKICNTLTSDYGKLKSRLDDMKISKTFPYKHVVVDEGQDFGKKIIEEKDILAKLLELVEEKGTFFLFYDRLQMVESDSLPSYISFADCRVTLYRNCRNTENIAITSLRPIRDRKPLLKPDAVKGSPVNMVFCADSGEMVRAIDKVINQYKEKGIKDIVILTGGSDKHSVLAGKLTQETSLYRQKYLCTTCSKFKGLEADVVIMIDVGASTFEGDNVMDFYVGTSRARINLDIITAMDDSDCVYVLKNLMKKDEEIAYPQRQLASALNARYIKYRE